MEIEANIVPVTPERWDDLVTVMGTCSYARKCWCAYWYLPNAEFKVGWGDANRAPLERLVKDGKFPAPVQVGENRIAWFEDEVDAHYARLAAERSPQPDHV